MRLGSNGNPSVKKRVSSFQLMTDAPAVTIDALVVASPHGPAPLLVRSKMELPAEVPRGEHVRVVVDTKAEARTIICNAMAAAGRAFAEDPFSIRRDRI